MFDINKAEKYLDVEKMLVDLEHLKNENAEFREILQCVIIYGRLYHHQKKALKKMGLEWENTALRKNRKVKK